MRKQYDELLDMIDLDLRAEEEALLAKQQHPAGIDYSCLCWCPFNDVDLTPATMGWHPPLSVRSYQRTDFPCEAQRTQQVLRTAVDGLYSKFEQAVSTAQFADHLQEQLSTLDPTQYQAYTFVTQWAQARKRWSQSLTASSPPRLRLLLLGTAGTGKTHTAKTFIGKARQTFGSFRSVLTLAFSGVAAANLGEGASTIDSIFHTNAADASTDLRGDRLDALVNRLRGVQMALMEVSIGKVERCRRPKNLFGIRTIFITNTSYNVNAFIASFSLHEQCKTALFPLICQERVILGPDSGLNVC